MENSSMENFSMQDFFQEIVDTMKISFSLWGLQTTITMEHHRKNRSKFFKGPEEYLSKILDIMKWKTSIKTFPWDDISYDEKSLRDYTYHYDRLINSGLRNNEIGDRFYEIAQELIKNIDLAPVYDNMILFRACNIEKNFEIGEIISDNAFMSKTCCLGVTGSFLLCEYPKLFIMEYSTPTKQLFMAPYSKFTAELEFLTYPGEKFEIVASYTVNKTIVYYTRFIGYDFKRPIIIETPEPPKIDHLRNVLEKDFVLVVTDEDLCKFYHLGERQVLKEMSRYRIEYLEEDPFEYEEEQQNKRTKLELDAPSDFEHEFIEECTNESIHEDTFEDLTRVIHGLFYINKLKNIYTVKITESQIFTLTILFEEKEKEIKTNVFTVIKSKIENDYISCDKDDLIPECVKVY